MNENTGGIREIRLPILRKEQFPPYVKANSLLINNKTATPHQAFTKSLPRNNPSPLPKKYFRRKSKNSYIDDPLENNYKVDNLLQYPLNPFASKKKPPLKKEYKIGELVKLPIIKRGSTLSPRSKFFKSLINASKNQAPFNLKPIPTKVTSTDTSPVTKKSKHKIYKALFNNNSPKKNKTLLEELRNEVRASYEIRAMKILIKKENT